MRKKCANTCNKGIINCMTMYDSQDGMRYTNEYLAQEYRNEAANAKYKLEKLQKENEELRVKIAELEQQLKD